MAGRKERGLEGDVDAHIPVGFAEGEEVALHGRRRDRSHAGVVDQDVDRPDLFPETGDFGGPG
jgi:hypothetical protein